MRSGVGAAAVDGDCPMDMCAGSGGEVLKDLLQRQGIELKGGGACGTRATTWKWARFACGFMHQSQPRYAIVGLRVSVILDLAFHLSFSSFHFFYFYYLLLLIIFYGLYFVFFIFLHIIKTIVNIGK